MKVDYLGNVKYLGNRQHTTSIKRNIQCLTDCQVQHVLYWSHSRTVSSKPYYFHGSWLLCSGGKTVK